jgi:hypothetical protein
MPFPLIEGKNTINKEAYRPTTAPKLRNDEKYLVGLASGAVKVSKECRNPNLQ